MRSSGSRLLREAFQKAISKWKNSPERVLGEWDLNTMAKLVHGSGGNSIYLLDKTPATAHKFLAVINPQRNN
jgi:hypothetical protein